MTVHAFTDGACSGNPGPGGWGVVLRWNGHEKELFGGEAQTTNNRMELMAAISALESLTRHSEVVITTDSTYVLKGITEWLPSWKRRNWQTASKQPVKNVDLWQQLDALVSGAGHRIQWHWVRGHTGHEGNERADALANRGVPRA